MHNRHPFVTKKIIFHQKQLLPINFKNEFEYDSIAFPNTQISVQNRPIFDQKFFHFGENHQFWIWKFAKSWPFVNFFKFFGGFYSFNYGISNSNKSILTFVMWTINDLSIEHKIEQLDVLFFVDLRFWIDVLLNLFRISNLKNLRFWNFWFLEIRSKIKISMIFDRLNDSSLQIHVNHDWS